MATVSSLCVLQKSEMTPTHFWVRVILPLKNYRQSYSLIYLLFTQYKSTVLLDNISLKYPYQYLPSYYAPFWCSSLNEQAAVGIIVTAELS